jgi:putative ABC transport system permease protein
MATQLQNDDDTNTLEFEEYDSSEWDEEEDEGPGSTGPFGVSVLMALRGLTTNRMRALLTMLGIIIGVGAVIVAVAIGQGSRDAVAASIQRLGTNVLTVRAGQQRRGGVSYGAGTSTALTLEDAEAIRRGSPSVLRVSPQVNRSAQVVNGNRNTNATINGTGADYPSISNHEVAVGRYFTRRDVDARNRVVVLGSDAATELFDGRSPVGKDVRIAGQSFTVVGVLKQKGGQGFQSPDDAAYIPVTTAMRRVFGLESVTSIVVQARTADLMEQAQTEIDALMRTRHHIAPEAAPDFQIFNQADIIEAQSAQQDTFASLITYLAIVSLLVGGIGIMNIMLVSVTERTREIGVRKAIGAKRRDVLVQFLLEALFLSLVGGLLGVLFGVGGSHLVSAANGWTVTVAPQSVVLAFSFAVLVGIFFGFYPAIKASRLNPIEALRYE